VAPNAIILGVLASFTVDMNLSWGASAVASTVRRPACHHFSAMTVALM
jgi:hypothetical protein